MLRSKYLSLYQLLLDIKWDFVVYLCFTFCLMFKVGRIQICAWEPFGRFSGKTVVNIYWFWSSFTFATLRGSFILVFGHCMYSQLTGTIVTPVVGDQIEQDHVRSGIIAQHEK